MSRREFVKPAALRRISLSNSRAALGEAPRFDARETLPGRNIWNPAARGAGRIDGPAKVTGAKIYASEFSRSQPSRGPTQPTPSSA
jgi:hypothetical protein